MPWHRHLLTLLAMNWRTGLCLDAPLTAEGGRALTASGAALPDLHGLQHLVQGGSGGSWEGDGRLWRALASGLTVATIRG